ncbi:MAG: thioredoxin reductase [Chloroflexota bacterium]|nr:thioredoxin reductase [Chloroflexota bacterium]
MAVPIILLPDGSILVDPDVHVLAERLGLSTDPTGTIYDLVIVGGGPAGVSAAISAGSEGLHTMIVEQDVPGGQAGYSALIENYPGFPTGMDGSALAERAVEQAERFGVELVVTRRATGLRAEGPERRLTLDDGVEIASQTILIAIGQSFRWLDAPGCASLIGAGVYYGAATVEASSCRDQEVYVLGGGNSAGQAALFLARFARVVHVLTTSDSLDATMSTYLTERLERAPNVVVHPHTTVADAGGGDHLQWILVRDTKTGETSQVPADALFVFIGAAPRSEWLEGTLDRDAQGFLLSGHDYVCEGPAGWPLERRPYLLETRVPGVFVAGDVRKDSVKRLTAAAGEGAMAVQFVHQYFRETVGLPALTGRGAGAVASLHHRTRSGRSLGPRPRTRPAR